MWCLIPLLFLPVGSSTFQVPEKMIFDGQDYHLSIFPLEEWLSDKPKLQDKHFSTFTTACWRGYLATWKIERNKLYLAELLSGDFKTQINLSDVFPNQETPVHANWFSGIIRIGKGELINRGEIANVLPQFGVWEEELYFRIDRGNVAAMHVVNNRGAGRFQSSKDREWVFDAVKEIPSAKEWIDARLVEVTLPEKVRTRGILNVVKIRPKKSKSPPTFRVSLYVPEAPATEQVMLQLELPKDENPVEQRTFVEVEIEWAAEQKRYRVIDLRKLQKGETIHHPEFKGLPAIHFDEFK